MVSGVIELGDITVHNLRQLKKLNQIVFPVSYNDKFYKDILEVGQLAKLGNLRFSLFVVLKQKFLFQPILMISLLVLFVVALTQLKTNVVST